MSALHIRRSTVAEFEAAPNLPEILAEYAEESSLSELGATSPQVGTYRMMEKAGIFYPIGAFDGARLAGFILPVVVVLPHYGVLAAVVESFFVPKVERKTGIGMKLLEHAEALARELGAKALLLSAPAYGVLSRVLSRTPRYRHSNETYITVLA